MAQVAKKKAGDGRQLSLLFEEDKRWLTTPDSILKCTGQRVAFDVETTGLQWWSDRIIGLGLYCPAAGVAGYIPVNTQQEQEEVKVVMQRIAQNPTTTLLAHNIKFDCHFLDIPLWQVPCAIGDTAIAAHLYDSRLQKNLGALEATFLHTSTKKETRGKGGGAGVQDMPLGRVAEYCVNDCRLTMALMDHLTPLLEELRLTRLFAMDMKHTRYLQRIERRGMRVDQEFCARAIARMSHNLELMERDLHDQIRALASANGQPDPLERMRLREVTLHVAQREAQKKGKPIPTKSTVMEFNWRSDDQLSGVIYEGCGIAMPKNPFADADGVDRTKFAMRGRYNATMTSSFLLMEKGAHPLGPLLMDMRESHKLRETLQKWVELADEQSSIHTSLNPTGTRTGRLSSSEPNLQNVAGKERVRDTQSVYSGSTIREEEYNLRLGLLARPGFCYLSLDHKQQEGRLFAVLAQDPDMIAAVKAREDIHGLVARMVWADDIARDPACFPIRREWAKTLAFGMLYGMTRGSMQHRLNKTQEESEAIMAQYQGRFKRVMPYLHETVERCKRAHLLRYWSGRIWREENETDMYKGTNAQVQGGGSDLMRLAAMRVQDQLDAWTAEKGTYCGELVDIIHDELLTEIPVGLLREAHPVLLQIMELENVLKIPFLADSKAGWTYGSLMKVEDFLALPENTIQEQQGANDNGKRIGELGRDSGGGVSAVDDHDRGGTVAAQAG